MASSKDPKFDLDYDWLLGESEWKTGMDNNLIKIGALMFPIVKDKDLTAPPGAEAEGDTYIPAATATGAWVGQEGKIAYYIGGAYRFYTPQNGWLIRMEDENNGAYFHNGTAWVAGIALPAGGNLLLSETTGSQIGTSQLQKLAFWGETPIERPASATQAAVTPTNTDGTIAALTFSATVTQAECEALRDACEVVADDMRANNALLNEIRSNLVAAGLIKGSA